MTRCLALVVCLVACRSDAEPPPASPKPAPRSTDALGAMPMRAIVHPPDPKHDPKTDPAFALTKLGPGRFQGRVADACPAGTSVVRPDKGFQLVGTSLEITLHGGGCPTYTGFTVVAKDLAELSPASRDRLPAKALPFYICADQRHDMCEAMMWNTWVFDVSALLVKSATESLVFAPPTPVDPDPASLCCCITDPKKHGDVETWPTCEVRGGTCDWEPECYGIEGPIP